MRIPACFKGPEVSAITIFYSCNDCYFILIVATPADVGLLMQLGVDGVFVGSGIFKSTNPSKRAKAMVQAVTHYNDPKILAEISEDLGEAMVCYQLSPLS